MAQKVGPRNAQNAVAESKQYDACEKGYIEPVGTQLPSTTEGVKAREKARVEGRLTTNKEARLAGKADEMPSEAKRRKHIEAEYAKYHSKK